MNSALDNTKRLIASKLFAIDKIRVGHSATNQYLKEFEQTQYRSVEIAL